jgi:hypothetical protein
MSDDFGMFEDVDDFDVQLVNFEQWLEGFEAKESFKAEPVPSGTYKGVVVSAVFFASKEVDRKDGTGTFKTTPEFQLGIRVRNSDRLPYVIKLNFAAPMRTDVYDAMEERFQEAYRNRFRSSMRELMAIGICTEKLEIGEKSGDPGFDGLIASIRSGEQFKEYWSGTDIPFMLTVTRRNNNGNFRYYLEKVTPDPEEAYAMSDELDI